MGWFSFPSLPMLFYFFLHLTLALVPLYPGEEQEEKEPLLGSASILSHLHGTDTIRTLEQEERKKKKKMKIERKGLDLSREREGALIKQRGREPRELLFGPGILLLLVHPVLQAAAIVSYLTFVHLVS